MATIETTEDLLRFLDENPEFLEAVRSKVLTQELMRLPVEYKADMVQVKSDVGVLKEGMAQVKSDVGEIKGSVAALDSYTQNLHSDYHRFRGAYAENAARQESGVIAGKITRARGTRVRSASRYSAEQLTAIFEQARDRDLLGDIDDESQDRFTNADDVLLVTERNRERSSFFVVTEVSHTMKFGDVHRACNHAKVIERVTGVRAFAVVAGVRRGGDLSLERVTDSPDDFVLRDDADTALVHEVEEDLEDPMTSPR